jgi:hypothetical protein
LHSEPEAYLLIERGEFEEGEWLGIGLDRRPPDFLKFVFF